MPGVVLVAGESPETGNERIVPCDSITKALWQIPLDHAAIHEGLVHHYMREISSLASLATTSILIEVPATGQYHLRAAEFQTTGGPSYLRLYEGPTFSAKGAAATAYNKNRQFNATTLLLYTGPTITDNGTQIDSHLVPTGGNQAGAILAEGNDEWVLENSTYYLVTIYNGDNSAADLVQHLEWYELPDKD